MKRLLIFTDPGLDDAMAISWLLHQKKLKETIIDIVAVAGNVTAAEALNNTFQIVEMYNEYNENINIWSSLLVEQKYEYNSNIHGGFFDNFEHECRYYRGEFLSRWDGSGDELDILIIASTTIFVAMLNIYNDINIRRIVIMGGGIEEVNYNNELEFNQGMDKNAFKDVLNMFKTTIELVTLDSCRDRIFDLFYLNEDVEKKIQRGVQKEIVKYRENAINRRSTWCIPYDLICAVAYLRKDLFYVKQSVIKGVDGEEKWNVLFFKHKASIDDASVFWNQIISGEL